MSSGIAPARAVATCLRCGAALTSLTAPCATCGTVPPPRARTGVRLAALTVDVCAVVIVTAVVLLATRSAAFATVAAIEAMLALWIVQARVGAGLGNLLVHVRVTRTDRPFTPGGARAFARALFVAGGMCFLIAGAWVVEATGAWDRRGHRSWADHATGTMVVEVPRRAADASVRRVSASASAARPATGRARAWATAAPPVPASVPPAAPARAAQTPPASTPAAVPAAPAFAPRVIDPEARPAAAPAPSQVPAPSAAAVPPPAPSAPAVPTPAPQPPAPPLRRRRSTPSVPPPRETAPPVSAIPDGPATPTPRPASEAPRPEAPIETLLPMVTGPANILLSFDTGQREVVPVPCAINLGRSPDPTETDDRLIVIDDPARTVSKTHARIEITEEGTWVTDLASTNGTELVAEDGVARTLTADARTYVEDGVRVRLGDRTLTFSRLVGGDA